MKNKKIIRLLVLLGGFVLAGFIIKYYWSATQLSELTVVPLCLMFIALGYILLQMLRRYLFKGQNWWDWLYYIGLSSMMLPIFFATPTNLNMFNLIADYGSFFFAIPLLLEVKLLMTKSEE
ncbi:MAG: hypothetical protein ACI865_003135 [Flavobacteriaceae bacterium]|jgi:hypothetical protein